MKSRKPVYDRILMLISILGITGFLLYWLIQNYKREEKSLNIKTEMAFRQTLMKLQAENLNLDLKVDTAKDGGMRIFMSDNHDKVRLRFTPKEDIISSINVIRDKYEDSMRSRPVDKKNMVISMNRSSSVSVESDSVFIAKEMSGHRGDRIFSFLYGVDSLQDSVTVKSIDSAFSQTLQRQQIKVPFTVIKKDSATRTEDNEMNEVTLGFAHPVTYQLQLGNRFPYLIRRIALPILFSVLLLGITILSFTMLDKNVQKQRKLAALKNEFISNITHELKTPIATVGVAIEALKNFNAIQDPQRTKEYLDISSNELQRLGLLVDKVLKLSMFENKGIELKKETIDLKDVTAEVVASLKLQFEKQQATINVNYEGDLYLQADKLHLQSVIFNLLDNALKYSRERPAITINEKEQGENIVLIISDNGIGIPTEYQQKIFEKFFRVPHGDTHNAKGYGLGLSYVAQVVAAHQGTIQVESHPDKGTNFIITLPKNSGYERG